MFRNKITFSVLLLLIGFSYQVYAAPLTAPTYVSAKALASDYINIIWYRTPNNEGTVTEYRVYRNGSLIATLDPIPYDDNYKDTAQNLYIDRDVSPSTGYNYHVVAHNSLGEDSPNSTIVYATTTSGSIGQLLPASRRADWSAGVSVGVTGGIDQYVAGRTNLIDVTQAPYNADNTGSADAQPAIQAAIDAATTGDVVYLPAGTYRTNNALYMQNRKNITIRGAGMSETLIDARLGGISVRGTGAELGYTPMPVLSGAAKGSTQVTVANADYAAVGDMIYLTTSNDSSIPVLASNGGPNLRGQFVEITNRSGNILTFSPAIVFDANPTDTSIVVIEKAYIAEKIGLEDFSIDGSNGTMQVGIGMSGARESWIKNVKVSGVTNYGVSFGQSMRLELRHSTIQFDHVGTSGGGILSGSLSSSLIEDNILLDTFPVTQLNAGSTGNVIAYNFMSGGEANTNHNPQNDYNLFEGNYSGSGFKSDGYYGGESNATYFRNYAAYLVQKRFSRNFNAIGNTGILFSIGQPNIGNGGSSGVAQPSQGVFWKDWNETDGPAITGVFTKASSTEGTFVFDSHEDAVRIYNYEASLWFGSGCIVSATVLTCDSPHTLDWGQGRDSSKYRFTYVASLNLDTDTAVIRVVYPTGNSLPDSGTAAAIWPRAEGFQELDMDAMLTTMFKVNNMSYSGGIPDHEALANGETLPDSLFRSSKPSYFGSLAWPAFSPTQTIDSEAIPAGYRYANNGLDPGQTDTTRPIISSVASTTASSTATITWSTNESATSTVLYGPTSAYGSTS
ncbi:MAG: glycosyl hydrolase family 28-related protein, partial [Patescibacteria group bacterium]